MKFRLIKSEADSGAVRIDVRTFNSDWGTTANYFKAPVSAVDIYECGGSHVSYHNRAPVEWKVFVGQECLGRFKDYPEAAKYFARIFNWVIASKCDYLDLESEL